MILLRYMSIPIKISKAVYTVFSYNLNFKVSEFENGFHKMKKESSLKKCEVYLY